MGDEHDSYDLPTQSQSGNIDIGHISENVQSEESRLRGIQSNLLTNTLNDYYDQNIGFSELESNLRDAGYSDSRIGEISGGAHAERVYRMHHSSPDGTPAPSGLSLNQLSFLGRQTGLNIERIVVHTDRTRISPENPEGVLYVDDYRVRDDGQPRRLYLPTAEIFDPLTQEQQSQIQIDETYLSYITLEEPQGTGEILQDNVDLQTRHEISQLITQYLTMTDRPGNDERRLKLYRDIQNLDGLQNQNNVRAKLLQLFNDIATEEQYRADNNGRPQGLTDTQWEQLQNNPNYYGQPILETDTNPPIKYIVSGTNYIEIDDSIEAPRRPREMNLDERGRINLVSTLFLTSDININTRESLSNNFLSTVKYDPEDPNDLRLRLEIEDLVNKLNQERIFRSQNNGRPSDISALQYEFMLNHSLSSGEPRYDGEPLERINLRDGTVGYGFHSYDVNIPELIIIPTDELVLQMIQAGTYTRPLQQEPTPDPDRIPPPDSLILPSRPRPTPSYIPPSATGLGEPRDPVVPGIIPEAPPGFDPPIVPGQQTQPINLRTGEDLPVDTPERNIIRYQQFYNDNQNLYSGFRDVFSNILPVLSAGAGAYMGYLYRASKEKSTIQTIIYQEQELLNNLEGRVEGNLQELQRELNLFQQRQDIAERTGQDIERILQREDITGGEMMRGLLVRRRMNELESISRIIERQKETITKLQNDIKDTQIYTRQTDIDIRNLQNTNYELFNNLYNYSPQILTGLSVGYTLGLMLSGYLFPTYMNINEPYITAENIEYTDNNKLFKKIQKDAEALRHLNKNNEDEISPVIKREYDPPPSKIIKPYKESFKPQKHGKRPLKYIEIQELKATLRPDELQKLKGKYLYFDEGKLNSVKSQDKCDNIIQEVQIRKRKVFK